jgi:putative aldouronate transport system substrate-binding protein
MKRKIASVSIWFTGLMLLMLAACNTAEKGTTQEEIEPKAARQPVTFTMSISTGGNKYFESSANINNDKWLLQLEKRANVDLEVIPIPDLEFDQKMELMFASNQIPDVVGNLRGGPTTPSMAGSVESGVFMPLDDLLKEYAPNLMSQVPKAAWEAVKYNGKIYGIPSWLETPFRRATFLRMDLLEQSGLEQPQTVEQFLDVLRAFKQMGVPHPYLFRENFKYADTFFGAYDVMPYQFKIVDGQVIPKFFDVDNMMKALQAYKTLYDEGLIPVDFPTLTQADYNFNLSTGKAGMWTANANSLHSMRTKVSEVQSSAIIDIVPSPTGDGKSRGYLLAAPIAQSFYINSKVSKEKAIQIIQFFDWMLTEEAEMFFLFGIEGETYTIQNGKVNYKHPENEKETIEQDFRAQLQLVRELSYSKKKIELLPDGQDLIRAFDEVLSREGVGTIVFNPVLESFKKYPELAPKGGDTGSQFIIDRMIRMIYGREPISNWPKVIEEWKIRGGDEIIAEATERYRNNDGVEIR